MWMCDVCIVKIFMAAWENKTVKMNHWLKQKDLFLKQDCKYLCDTV
jgi:hypothetical protein